MVALRWPPWSQQVHPYLLQDLVNDVFRHGQEAFAAKIFNLHVSEELVDLRPRDFVRVSHIMGGKSRPGECSTVPFQISICISAFKFPNWNANWRSNEDCRSSGFETYIEQLKIVDWNGNWDEMVHFLSVQQLRQIITLKHKLRWETGLLNTSPAPFFISANIFVCISGVIELS